MIYDMMAGCQVGRGPSMLAAYNYISLIVNTIQRKKRGTVLGEDWTDSGMIRIQEVKFNWKADIKGTGSRNNLV